MKVCRSGCLMSEKCNDRPHFRTVVEPVECVGKIEHGKNILSIGSCFSENIANKLEESKFTIGVNPTGILYNPLSIVNAIRRILEKNKYVEDDLFFHEENWKSFDHHSRFNGKIQHECLEKINNSLDSAIRLASNLDTLIITFGTAFVYSHKLSRENVANCHRLPHDTFSRSLLAIDSIVQEYTQLFNILYKKFPKLNIVITISPVRHLRDNPHENQVSKAHLFAACYELEQQFGKLCYFPSYEIVMDELRDYRFYNHDMVHPSNLAIDYVWERFQKTCIQKRSRNFIAEYASVFRSRNHLVKNSSTDLLNKFVLSQLNKIDVLAGDYPEIDFKEDRDYFNKL